MSTTSAEPIVPIAKKTPLRKSELDSRSVKQDQKPQITMPGLTEPLEHEPLVVVAEPGMIKNDFEKLAFNEEPVSIIIHRSGERNASNCTDYIAVNGKPAEMLFKNGWIPMGYLPRGVVITTKRKYLERLAASKKDDVQTKVVEVPGQDPQNLVDRITSSTLPFSLIEDKNPLGAEWLSQMLRQQG